LQGESELFLWCIGSASRSFSVFLAVLLNSFNLLQHKPIRQRRHLLQLRNPCTNPSCWVYHLIILPTLHSLNNLINIFSYLSLVFLQRVILVPAAWSIAGAYRCGVMCWADYCLGCSGFTFCSFVFLIFAINVEGLWFLYSLLKGVVLLLNRER